MCTPNIITDKDWEAYEELALLEQKEKSFLKKVEIESNEKKAQSKQYSFFEKSNKHLDDSNMSYGYHLTHSVVNGNKLLLLALSSYIHALLPWKLKQHAARGVIKMYEDMKIWPHLRRAMLEETLKRK